MPGPLRQTARTARVRAEYAAAFRRRRNPIAYLGWVGKGNAGDDGMLEAHRRSLAPLAVVPLPTTGIESALRWADSRVSALGVDVVLMGGGTVFGRRDWRERLVTLAPHLPGAATVAVGIGVEEPAFANGRFTDDAELDRWAELAADWPVLSVRGPRSSALLAQHGLQAPVAGDPALLLGSWLPPQPDVQERTLGVSLAEAEARFGEGDAHGSVEDALLPALTRFVADGWRLRLFAFSHWDAPLVERLHRRFGASAEAVSGPSFALLEAVQRCHVVVGERLHALVFAAAAGTPAVGLAYRPKVLDFADSVGTADLMVRTDRLTPTRVEELLRAVATDRTAYGAAVTARVELLRKRLLGDLGRVQALTNATG